MVIQVIKIKFSTVECSCTVADTSVSFVSRVKRLWLGWLLSFTILYALCRRLTISLMLSRSSDCTNDVLIGFNHTLQSLPVLGRA